MTQHKTMVILMMLASLSLLITVGTYGVIETSDARYAEIAREMFLSKDWLHPNLLDIHHYHKPPVTYQITALGYDIFGINPLGARFFLQISIILQMLLVYLLTLQFTQKQKIALWAAAIYFTFPLVLVASRNLTTDSFLTLFVLLCIYAWVRYRKSGFYGWIYLFTISLGIGFLTKGPVVFLVPFIFVLLYNRMENAKQSWSLHHLFAWGLFLIIASSWFIYLAVDNPAFWDYFIGKQTVDRFSHNVFNRSEPFWYFIVFAPLLGMPWLLVFPWMIKKTKLLFNTKSIEIILLLSVLIPLVFFSISTSKRVLYILPLYPLLAVTIALLLERLPIQSEKTLLKSIAFYALFIFTTLGIAPYIDGKIIFPPYLSGSSLLLIAMLLWFVLKGTMQTKSKTVLISFVTAVYFLLAATTLFSYSVKSFKIATPVVQWLKEKNLDKREILVYNKRLPSLAFELNRSTISLYDGDRSLNREVQFEKDNKWKSFLYNISKEEDRLRLKKYLQGKDSLLVTYKKTLPKIQLWLIEKYAHTKKLGKWTIYY